MDFKQYVLMNEADLEDLYVSDDATDNIELLHEMEFKLRQIIDHKYSFNPKMYVNLIKRFSGFAIEAYEDLSEKFENVYTYWLEIHAIDNPKEWAESTYTEIEELIEDAGIATIGGVSI
ncbi:MAG: hypothetical protein KAH32_08760, partial [Chlamydiia bacterium]|nr:hypothetical protein [Chlamydiia bacterium]